MTEKDACEFPKFHAAAEEIGEILRRSKTIAVVGLSPRPERPSYHVAQYLQSQGYTIIPVNPGHAEILGEKAYKTLLEIPGSIDIVDIFRKPEAVGPIAEEAIAKKAKVLWMQEGIINNEAAGKAKAAGLAVVMNRCIMKDHWALHIGQISK